MKTPCEIVNIAVELDKSDFTLPYTLRHTILHHMKIWRTYLVLAMLGVIASIEPTIVRFGDYYYRSIYSERRYPNSAFLISFWCGLRGIVGSCNVTCFFLLPLRCKNSDHCHQEAKM